MKSFLLIFTLLFGLCTNADLLEKIKIEDAIRMRVEENIKIFDATAKVQVQFQYRVFKGALPGLTSTDKETFTPNKVEASDIVRVNLKVFSVLNELTTEMSDTIYSQIPVERYKVSINYVKIAAAPLAPPTVQPKDLHDVVDKAIEALMKILGVLAGAVCLLLLINSFVQTRKRLKAMKEQVTVLATAIGEGSTEHSAMSLGGPRAQADRNPLNAGPSAAPSNLALENFGTTSIRELIADSYWSENDEYAHWVWQNVSNAQKKELLMALPFMRAYAMHFIHLPAVAKNDHDHPYYLEPMPLAALSQNDLVVEVKKNKSLFNHLSPLRQGTLNLTFEEKLKALNSNYVTKLDWQSDKQSALRSFATQMQWGHLSDKDESTLFKNSNLVPAQVKESILSLAWLAQRDDDYIRAVLAKYDARALASAWVAPDEILQKLETFLPEKKLKNLLAYKQKNAPNKNSVAYLSLVREGLKNDAA